MDDKFVEEMSKAAVKMLERATSGEKLNPQEIEFIMAAKDLGVKKPTLSDQISGLAPIANDLVPILQLLSGIKGGQ